MKNKTFFYKTIWLLGFIVSFTIIAQAENINTHSTASIQATAMVINPLGLTDINDNYLTTNLQTATRRQSINLRTVSNQKITYDSLLLRIPFSGNVILEVAADKKIVKQINFINSPDTNINPQEVKEIGNHSFLLNLPSLFKDIYSPVKQYQITLIYSEN
ncbi:MAG: hypothetical protein GXO93_01480 [FCB group bacterium]|nr:hypothetical protein [FCB group bacterium]